MFIDPFKIACFSKKWAQKRHTYSLKMGAGMPHKNKHKLLGLPSSPELQLSMESITFLVCKLSILYRQSYYLSMAVPIEIGKIFVKSVLLEHQGTMNGSLAGHNRLERLTK